MVFHSRDCMQNAHRHFSTKYLCFSISQRTISQLMMLLTLIAQIIVNNFIFVLCMVSCKDISIANKMYVLQGGEKSIEGSSGFTFSGTKSFGVTGGFVNEAEIAAQPVAPVVVEAVKPVYKTVHTEVNLEAANEVKPLPLTPVKAEFASDVKVKAEVPATVIIKEVSKLRETIGKFRRRRTMAKFEKVISNLFRIFSPSDNNRRLRQSSRDVYEYRQVCLSKYV